MTYDEIERHAYIKGDVDMANYAALAGEAEAELDGIEERLADSFEEGKLERSDLVDELFDDLVKALSDLMTECCIDSDDAKVAFSNAREILAKAQKT